MKIILRLTSIIMLITILAACSSDDGASKDAGGGADKKSFFINPKNIGPAYWAVAEEGVKKAGEELGVEVTFNAPTEPSSSDQINMIEDMLIREFDGMAVSPNDAESAKTVINKAIDQDIEMITWDTDSEYSGRNYFVAPEDDYEIGKHFAKVMAEEIGEEGEVGIMLAGLGMQNQIDRVDGVEDYFAENHPDIEVVNIVDSDEDQEKSFNNAQNLINSYPNLKGIIGFSGGEPPAAAQAVKKNIEEGKLKKGDIAITGFAVPSLVEDYLKEEIINTIVTWDPAELGYLSVYVLNEMVEGNEITEDSLKEATQIDGISMTEDKIFTGTIELTKDNVDEFDF